MKIKNFIKIIVVSVFSLIIFPCSTNAKEYEYTNLDIKADILIDGTIDIQETYTTNFFVKKHGTVRDIKLNYSVDGAKFHTEVSDIYIKGKKYKTEKLDGIRRITIGDPNVYEYGKVSYPISYSMYGLIRNFSGMGYAELYWNIVGYEFDTNIQKVSATINLPKEYTGFKSTDFLITTDGKTKTVEEFQGTVDWSQGNKIIITYNKNLPANHGITLAIKFPNNYFEFNHKKQAKLIGYDRIGLVKRIITGIISIVKTLNEEYVINGCLKLGVPIIFILAIIFVIVKGNGQQRFGKFNLKKYGLKGDFADKYKIIVQYAPPKGLNSAEVGLLLHRESTIKDLFSLVYKRAAEGLIAIDSKKSENSSENKKIKSIKIRKMKDIPESVPDFEKTFFNSFIKKEGKELLKYHENHSSDLVNLKTHGVKMGWFKDYNFKDLKIKLRALIIFLLIIFINIVIPIILVFEFIALFLYCIFKKPQENVTEKGAELIAHILGYGIFLSACDEKQLRKFLEEDPLYFDKTLPFAVVYGLETEFLEKILPIMEEEEIEPSWNNELGTISIIVKDIGHIKGYNPNSGGGGSTSYSRSSGFSRGSSFSGGFSAGGGGGGGGGHSW